MKKRVLLSSLFLLAACNSNSSAPSPVPSKSGVEISPITAATATPSATPVVIPTPRPTSTPVASTCNFQNLTFQVSDTLTRSVSGLTEGFSFNDGLIYESTGAISGHGASVLNAIDIRSGQVRKLISTPSSSFGEGLVKLNGYFYQLTYTEGKIYQYTSDGTAGGTKLLATFNNPLSEGWGLTTDGIDLLASDGSSYLYHLDPKTMLVKSKVKVVNSAGAAISGLNELEYVDGQIYANLFPTTRLIRFDANLGCQTGEMSMLALQKSFSCSTYPLGCTTDSVPNGIAYDQSAQAFYLTGKSWPFIYKGQFK